MAGLIDEVHASGDDVAANDLVAADEVVSRELQTEDAQRRGSEIKPMRDDMGFAWRGDHNGDGCSAQSDWA